MQFLQIPDIIKTQCRGGSRRETTWEVCVMERKDLYMGMGMGIAASALGAMLLRPRRNRKVKSAMGKALRTMSEVADSVSDAMGW